MTSNPRRWLTAHAAAALAMWSMTATLLLAPGQAEAADTIATLATAYEPTINETIDASGFKHPGVGLTRDMLENVRTQVRAQKEPWNEHFNAMLLSTANSARNLSSSNQGSDPTKPGSLAFSSQSFNGKFIADGLKAYTQALLYYITGDEIYRANAMRIIRIWAQMDPAQYVYFNDAHIHTGIPLSRMVAAAEILRYTSCQTPALEWTEQDTQNFTNNLIVPVTETFNHTNWRFMNQHTYPLLGSMSGYIFTGNRARYNEAVEWFTVNKTAVDQGQNGAIKPLFRLVDKNDLTGEAVTPMVQHVEMGRDQAHGGGDITNVGILARLMNAQGTKVDPVEGTASTASNAVGPYEFLNDRILDASDYFARYMLGNATPWTPTASHTDANGTPTVVYRDLAPSYRGRLTSSTWEPYYYYKYVKGVDMEQRAPYLSRMFALRTSYNWAGPDGGGDYWLFIPAAGESEGAQLLKKPIVEPFREVEDRYTVVEGEATAMQDETTSFLRVNTTSAGTRIAIPGYGNASKNLAFRIRTNGVAALDAFDATFALPDTQGQWRYVSVVLDVVHSMGDMLFLTVRGDGAQVDIDHINVQGTSLTVPSFTDGEADLNLVTYASSGAAITRSFAATDANPGDTITYQADNLPAGASFDTATGAFSWLPTQAGTYTFVVSSTDGITVKSKTVNIVVTADRQSALAVVSAPYKANVLYVSSTLDRYNAARAAAMAVLSGTDAAFQQALGVLSSAVAGLQELTPLLADGSMNYVNMFLSSSFGTGVPKLLDNSPFTSLGAPTTYAPYLANIMDFGPDFKVAASMFQMQVRASFPERMGGVAMFGSNDSETWTRLTPELTVISDDMQTLQVADALKNQRFRFFKMQMVQPTFALLEVSELRIFGTRYETVNKIASVTIGSDQSLKRRIIPGNTVKLTFQSKEAINNVTATVQGQPAVVSSVDSLNWTATTVVNASAPPGNVKFLINAKTANGIDAEPTFFTTDGSSLFIADQSGLLNPIGLTALSDSAGKNQTELLAAVNTLQDSSIATFTDFRLNGSGNGGWIKFDFKGGGLATLNRVEVIGRQDSYASRIGGTVVQGSNDNATWASITPSASTSSDWQTLKVNSTTPYRYIRVTNNNAWFGNMTELRMYGAVESTNLIASASLSSPQALRTRIVPGNSVKVTFTAKEAINNVSATIQGVPATVDTTDNITFTATAVLPQGTAPGAVTFAINYKTLNGRDGYPNTATTDGSALNLVDESDVLRNLGAIATLIDSTVNRSAATTLGMVNALGDSNLSTVSDFRIGSTNSGTGSYITFDFKEGNQATLTGVELAPRQDQYYTRIKSTVIRGSNDNVNWTSLTAGAASTLEWQTLPVAGSVPYRYIRIYNSTAWVGNMSEVRFHGTLHAADTTAPVTQANAPGVTIGATTTVTLSATDAESGVQATYYTIDGGAQKTGSSFVVPADGPHSLTYWSVDWAGNVEQKHTFEVTLDKTAPVLAGLYADITAPTNQNVTVTVYYPLDAVVKDVKLGETGTWTAYTAPVVLTGNGTVYARSADAVGNVSAIASLAVTNINKIPPAGAGLAVSSTEPTSGNVTVTIAYPANVAVRQYRIGSGAWTAYTGPLSLTENGVVYAQSIDSVGNVSPVTSYAVTNIDRVAPVDAGFAADFTEPTRNDVTVTLLFPSDTATREYRIGADGEWKAYGAPVLMSANGVVFARSADAAGNQSAVTQYTVDNIDRIAPAGAALTLDTTAPTNQAVTVSIAWPEDAVFKEVKVGEGEWTPYTTGAVVVAEESTVFARSSDAVGNRSNETSIVVSNIFKVVPSTNATLNPASPNGKNTWYTSDVSVTLAVNPGSYGGAVTTEYQVNGSAWTASTGAAIVFEEGVHQLGFRSRDQAGNVEQVKSIGFKVDKTMPTLSVVLDKTMIWPPNHQMVPVNAALSAADAGSGIDSVVLTNITSNKPDSGRGGDVEAEFGKPVSSFAVRAEKDSVYTVTYTATDQAGNKTVKTATVTVPRGQPGL